MPNMHPVIKFLGKIGRYGTDVTAPLGVGTMGYELSNHNPYIALISGSLTAAVFLINELYVRKKIEQKYDIKL